MEAARGSDGDLDDAIDLAESTLIDEYVQSQLSADDATIFERVFLTTQDRKDRLAMSKGIHRVSTQERSWIQMKSSVFAGSSMA